MPRRLVCTKYAGFKAEAADEAFLSEAGDPILPRKVPSEWMGVRTKTDTGRWVEHTKAIGRTVVKELGKMAP